MVRAGLIGFGLAGQTFHAPTLRAVQGMELACILERSGSRARQKYPDVRVVPTLEELLADQSVRLCVVATPNTSHFDLARRCLLAERDVVVDKPFTTTLAEAIELTRLAAHLKRRLTVFHSRRWDGDFQTVKRLVESGVLGRMAEYEARYDRFRPDPKANAWRERRGPGSGVWFDLGPHLVDQALLLFGEPQTITASIFCQREWSEVEDAFDVCLQYPGLRALLRARMLAYAPGPHFLLHGSKGSFVKYGMDPQEDRLRRGEVPNQRDWGAHWGEEPESQWGILSVAGADSRKVTTEAGDYRGFYANVRDAMEKGTPLAVTAEQGLRTMRVLDLAQKSSREGRSVPWPESMES
jgi:scyllo-inositol 2-dehydrogenase (NADP+)